MVLVTLALSSVVGLVAMVILRRLPQADLRATETLGEELQRSPKIRRFLRSRMEPGVATGLALTATLVLTVFAGTLIGVLVYMIRKSTGMVGWDLQVAGWAGDHSGTMSTKVLEAFTQLGATITIVVLSVATAIFAYRRWKGPSVVFFLLAVVGGQLLVSNLIKAAVARTRPDIHPLAGFSGPSFPSGHTTAAAATFAAIALVMGRGRSAKTRAVLGGIAVGVAVAVGCSRVFLGVHWLSDALAGLVLGWSWFAICTVAFGGRILRFGAPAEVAAAPAGSTPKITSSAAR
ncbi:MAG: phosphatase PAP2 family protein [Actinomycetota bacterium]